MVLFNYSTKELTAKIVYYGPGLCGKTTNLQFVHKQLPDSVRGKMLSLATKTDRTLFFDFLPIDLGEIRGMQTRVQLYTVPGQVFYNETRKLVLKGADGIVFVADSQQQMLKANVESFKNLDDNLRAHGLELCEMPHVIQFNKRDLPRLASLEEMNAAINKFNAPFYESVATTGIGVQDTLKAITKLVLLHLTKKYDPRAAGSATRPTAAPRPVAPSPAQPLAAAPARPTAAAVAPQPAAAPGLPLSVLDLPVPPAARPAPRAVTVAPSVPALPADEIDRLVDEVDASVDLGAGEDDAASVAEPLAAPGSGPDAEDVSIGFDDDSELFGAEPVAAAEPGVDPGPSFEIDDAELAEPAHGAASGAGEASDAFALEDELSSPADDPLAGHAAGPRFEVDLAADPEWSIADSDRARPRAPRAAPAPVRREAPRAAGAGFDGEPAEPDGEAPPGFLSDAGTLAADPALNLVDAIGAAELFEDPDLEVARLASGERSEIVVPVELRDADAMPRRFKLSIRLALEPLD